PHDLAVDEQFDRADLDVMAHDWPEVDSGCLPDLETRDARSLVRVQNRRRDLRGLLGGIKGGVVYYEESGGPSGDEPESRRRRHAPGRPGQIQTSNESRRADEIRHI